MVGRMKGNVGPLGVLGALLLCLPCLLPFIAVLGGVAVFTALGGFIADNAFVVGLDGGGAIASLAAGAYLARTHRRRGAVCASPGAHATPVIEAFRRQP